MATTTKKVVNVAKAKVRRNIAKTKVLKAKRNEKIKTQRAKCESSSKPTDDLKFDEESIKSRVKDMLEDFKKQGGVLELGESDDGDEIEQSDVDESMDDDEEPDSQNETTGTKAEEEDKKDREKQREKRKFDFERNSRTIFVGNLPKDLDQKDVIKIFKSCGQIESARIRSVVPEKEKLAPKVALITKRIHPKVDSVNAYVVFKTNENDESVKKALAMNGKLVDGHHIRVDRAQRPKAKRETLTSRKKSVFVGNLRFDIRDDDVINHFEKSGAVNYVRIVRDRNTGLGKGFGFVVFHERASVKKALELNDTDFKGRKLRVKKVEQEEKDGTKPNKKSKDKGEKMEKGQKKTKKVKMAKKAKTQSNDDDDDDDE